MLHLNHLVLLATSKETFHGDNAPKHAFTRPRPSISPRLTKALGRRVALHGTWHGSWIVPLSSLILDFVILRWHPETLEWVWQPLIGFPALLPRNVSLAASKIRFVHLGWITTHPQMTVTICTPWRLRLTIIPGSSVTAHGVITGYGVPVSS